MRYKLLELDSVSILLFVIVVTCFGVSVGKAGATPASLTNLNSLLSGNLDPYSDNYIRIQYPTGWEVLRPGVNFRVDTTDVIFMPKSEYQNYLFSPLSYMPSTFIQVSTYPARNLTLPEFTSIVVNNISSNFAAKILPQSPQNETLSGIPAEKIEVILNESLFVLDTWAIKNNTVYRVSSYTNIGNYIYDEAVLEKVRDPINDILDSFGIRSIEDIFY